MPVRPPGTTTIRTPFYTLRPGNFSKVFDFMVTPARFERAAYGLGNRRSIQLSYGVARYFNMLAFREVSLQLFSRPGPDFMSRFGPDR